MASSRKTEAEIPEARKGSFLEILEAVVIALLLAFVIRTFAVQAFKIPSGSMIPTLLVGDHILVNKFLFGTRFPLASERVLTIRSPERGDILVFKFPKDHKTDYIKRLVGEPGETVEIVGENIYVNGELWEGDPGHYEGLKRDAWRLPGDSLRFGPIYVPRKGDAVKLVNSQLFVNDEVVSIPGGKIMDEGSLKDYYDVFYADLFPPEMGRRANSSSESFTVDEDRFFMVGDNRDNSRDGRFWGLIRDSEIRGKAFIIYWSWDRVRHRVRWGRVGDVVE